MKKFVFVISIGIVMNLIYVIDIHAVNAIFKDNSFYRKANIRDPGTIHVFIKNKSNNPISINKMSFNDNEMTSMPDDFILWHQMVPPIIAPDKQGDIVVKLKREPKRPVRIFVEFSNEDTLSMVINNVPIELKFSFIGFDRQTGKVYIYLENESEDNAKIYKLFVNDEDVTEQCNFTDGMTAPIGKTLIIFTPTKQLSYNTYVCFKVVTDKGIAESMIRVYSYFPIATFGSDTREEMCFDTEYFEINYSKNTTDFEKEKKKSSNALYHLLGDPACFDSDKRDYIGTSAKEIIENAKINYENDSSHGNFIYCCEWMKPYSYYVYGELTDVMVINPYEMFHGKNDPARNAYYTSIAKKVSEPKLLWTCPEAFSCYGSRFPTPLEERIIVYSEIAQGSKGIWYYVFDKEIGYLLDKNLENEIKQINWELRQVRDYILIGEPYELANTYNDSVVANTLLCGDKGIILILQNKDYRSYFGDERNKFQYNRKEQFLVEISVPKWMKIENIVEISYPKKRDINFTTKEGLVSIPIDFIDATKLFLLSAENDNVKE